MRNSRGGPMRNSWSSRSRYEALPKPPGYQDYYYPRGGYGIGTGRTSYYQGRGYDPYETYYDEDEQDDVQRRGQQREAGVYREERGRFSDRERGWDDEEQEQNRRAASCGSRGQSRNTGRGRRSR